MPAPTGHRIATPTRLRTFLVSLILLLATTLRDEAATLTWTGGGASDDTNLIGNWGFIPATGDLLHFAGTTRLTPNQVNALSIGSLTFDSGAGAFSLGGNTYTITGASGVTNNSTNTQTINNAITLGLAQTWSATSGNLVFGGNIATGGFVLTITGGSNTSASGNISGTGGLTKTGAGTLTLSGVNTYTGKTTIQG
ncbi:MAG TPA: autotransporter-associated beta strand repeat-containing protein, partial [Chthoniobacterales bacterium]|nr:autotransporter-associated beta strand repeat-containing protein [Chthoniobacterales bacterium]